MRTGIAVLIVLLATGCALVRRPPAVSLSPMGVQAFLERPFGHNESVEAFLAQMPPRTHAQRLIRRSAYAHHRPDTIYNLRRRRFQIAVYKTQHGQQFLLGGNITGAALPLANGVRVGMSREQFHAAFLDLHHTSADTVKLVHPATNRTFNFLFGRGGRLTRISFIGGEGGAPR